MSDRDQKPKTLLILLLPQEWPGYVRRPHWEAIGRRTTVLAVEPPTGLLVLWLHPSRLVKYLRSSRKPRPASPGIHLWRPLTLLSIGLGFRLPALAAFDRWWVRRQLTKALEDFDTPDQKTISFVVKVQQHYLQEAIVADLRCYELTDEYRVATGADKLDPTDPHTVRIARHEAEILARTDLVIASSVRLQQSRSQQHDNTHYLPNCVDYDFFSGNCRRQEATLPELASIAHPRAGYIGGFNDLLDLTLLNRLAEERPELSIVIIGEERGTAGFRQTEAYAQFKAHRNVHFLGHQLYESLPGIIAQLDVCLLPFRINEWMLSSSPNKTYQYLAVGKPVVATPFPEAVRVEAVVSIAADHSQFIELVDRALATDDKLQVAQRQEIAKANSTDARAEALLKLVWDTLEKKTGHAR